MQPQEIRKKTEMEGSLIGKIEGHVYIPRLHRVHMGWASLAISRKMIDGQNVL